MGSRVPKVLLCWTHSQVWSCLQRSGWWSSGPSPRCPDSTSYPSRQETRRSWSDLLQTDRIPVYVWKTVGSQPESRQTAGIPPPTSCCWSPVTWIGTFLPFYDEQPAPIRSRCFQSPARLRLLNPPDYWWINNRVVQTQKLKLLENVHFFKWQMNQWLENGAPNHLGDSFF